MTLANDMTLSMIPGDEHVLITSARHPVSYSSHFEANGEVEFPGS
jgi:hypothetical protein